jgi:type IV pilus assembly protein PilE
MRGFTLIELVIAVVLVAILAAVAIPAFTDAIRKGRRSEALASLSALQQAQERWRANHSSYSTDMSSAGLNQPTTSIGSGYYGIAITAASATDYELTATATAGKSQANDADCQVMAVKLVAGGEVKYGSGASTANWADPKRCWAR